MQRNIKTAKQRSNTLKYINTILSKIFRDYVEFLQINCYHDGLFITILNKDNNKVTSFKFIFDVDATNHIITNNVTLILSSDDYECNQQIYGFISALTNQNRALLSTKGKIYNTRFNNLISDLYKSKYYTDYNNHNLVL